MKTKLIFIRYFRCASRFLSFFELCASVPACSSSATAVVVVAMEDSFRRDIVVVGQGEFYMLVMERFRKLYTST